ncbi:MAG TPA: hypothetical protein VGM76_17030 [Lacipirellulaceae bacterium]|jgi:hypothetical protein
MRQHNLPRAWPFGFDRCKIRFDKCDFAKKYIPLSHDLVEANGIKAVPATKSCVVRMSIVSYNSISGSPSLLEFLR